VEEARARPPSTAERKALDMVAAGPVLEIVRVFHVADRPVEFSTAVVPAARTLLRFETSLP
jgi:DNA-binding GntR family transcriptional regulator